MALSEVTQHNPVMQRFQMVCDPYDQDSTDDVSRRFRDLCLASEEQLGVTLSEHPEFVTQQDGSALTLLHHLAASTCLTYPGTLIQVAIEKGASCLARDSEGYTPLHSALMRMDDDRCIHRSTFPALLGGISDQALVSLMSCDAPHPLLHFAARFVHIDGMLRVAISIVPQLIERLRTVMPPDEFLRIVNACDADGWTALDYALENRNRAAVEALFKAGAALVDRSYEQIDAMIQNRMRRHKPLDRVEVERSLGLADGLADRIQIYHHLLKRVGVGEARAALLSHLRSDIRALADDQLNDAEPYEGYTLLHCATIANDTVSVSELVCRGAQVSIPNRNDVVPVELAALNGHSETYALLKAHGAVWTLPEPHPEISMMLLHTSTSIAEYLLRQYNVTDLNRQYHHEGHTLTLLEAAFRAQSIMWILLLHKKGICLQELFSGGD